ncbi:hypothetical protein [Natronococcus jeotgali]|uniref:hypothetical protein n=1 Tax=Natronococcus jeotgali TaxID=413812 RepID=UPI001360B2A4|nr:hypothetical protein [Natronococcus jeotgali]
MYNASRGIHYTAPPGPESETDETAEDATEPTTTASADDAASASETGLAADD